MTDDEKRARKRMKLSQLLQKWQQPAVWTWFFEQRAKLMELTDAARATEQQAEQAATEASEKAQELEFEAARAWMIRNHWEKIVWKEQSELGEMANLTRMFIPSCLLPAIPVATLTETEIGPFVNGFRHASNVLKSQRHS